MNSRAFFSVYVALFALIFLISLFYAQRSHFDLQSREAEVGVLHQQLSKDWFLLRNSLSNFASDAILSRIDAQHPFSPVNCNFVDIVNYDYGADINAAWDDVTAHTNTNFGTNCDVNLSGEAYLQFESAVPNPNVVRSGQRAYGILSCTRSTTHATLTLRHAFVIRKEVRVQNIPSVGCVLSVYDRLGDNPSAGINFEKLDVNKTYP